MAITITVKGVDELRAKYRRLVPLLADFNRAWPAVKQSFIGVVLDRFATRGHGTWRALSPGYAAWKADHYPGQPILVATGRMRQEVTTGARVTATAKTLTFTTNNAYWFYHQYGTRRMPARPIFKLNRADEAKFTQDIERYVAYSLDVTGLT